MPTAAAAFRARGAAGGAEGPGRRWTARSANTSPSPRPTSGSSRRLPRAAPAAVVLDRRTRMLYDARHVFINGESCRASGRDAALMRALADRRSLGAGELARASEAARALLQSWCEAGWAHARRSGNDIELPRPTRNRRCLPGASTAARHSGNCARRAGLRGARRLARDHPVRRRLRRLAAGRARGGRVAAGLVGHRPPLHAAGPALRRGGAAPRALRAAGARRGRTSSRRAPAPRPTRWTCPAPSGARAG